MRLLQRIKDLLENIFFSFWLYAWFSFVLFVSILIYLFALIRNSFRTIFNYKYQILCFILFTSLVINVSLYHENRIYQKGILQAMKMIGLGGLDDDSLPVKSQLSLVNQYLEELWFENFLKDEFFLKDEN